MQAEVISKTLYKVVTNSDTTEGRGRSIDLGYYLTRAEATKAAKGEGIQGTDALVEEVRATIVMVPGYQIDGVSQETFLLGAPVHISFKSIKEQRAEALAKLTPTEKRILGIIE